MAEVKLYAYVCGKCGRQVRPHEDHNLGLGRTVYCDHGRGGVGTMETVAWKRIEVVPVEQANPSPEPEQEKEPSGGGERG